MMFGPRQVGEVIVGNGLATEKTIDTFVATAKDKQVSVVGAHGGEAVANKPFIVAQKTNGDAAKGLNYNFSDRINPRMIEKVIGRAFAPEVMGVGEITGFDNPDFVKPMRTYEISIRAYSELSPRNSEDIFGYYITGEVIGSDTKDTILKGLVKSLETNLKHRGNSEFTVTAGADKITVTEKEQPLVLGKKDGRKIEFKLTAKVFDNVSNGYNANLGILKTAIVTKPFVGNGTGKRAANYEWFCHGYKYDPSRQYSHPINFEQPAYVNPKGEYDTIQVVYFSSRTETIVERQYKVLTIFVEKGKGKEVFDAVSALATSAHIESDLA